MSVSLLLGCQSNQSAVSKENRSSACSADELRALINKEAEEMKASIKDEYDSDIIFKYAQQFYTCNVEFDAEEPFVFHGAEGRRPFSKWPVRLTLIKRRTETGAAQTCVSRVQLAGDREPKTECRAN
jgi:hypothetical protein